MPTESINHNPFITLFKRHLRLSLTLMLIVTLLASLLMMANILEDPKRYSNLYTYLLVISSLGLIMLTVLIGLNVYDLINQVRQKRPGARLIVRLVLLFLILTTTPLLLVYFFSLEFLHQRLDTWFDTNLENGAGKALELSKASLLHRRREAVSKTREIADALLARASVTDLPPLGDEVPAVAKEEPISSKISRLRMQYGATEIALLEDKGRIIAFSSADTLQLLPTQQSLEPLTFGNVGGSQTLLPKASDVLSKTLLPKSDSATAQGSDYQVLESLLLNNAHYRTLLQLPPAQGESTPRFLITLLPIPEELADLTNNVEDLLNDFKEASYLRAPLTQSFSMVLSLVLLLSIFSAAWAAFITARRLVSPIRDLAEGTQAVAQGDYDKQVPASHLDEIGFLVQSFNQMIDKLRFARDAAKQNQQLADDQLAYLEIILERLSSGVISLDHELQLRTSNAAAEHILGVELHQLLGQKLPDACDAHPPLQALCETALPHLQQQDNDWQAELTLFSNSGRKVLICRGTHLPALANNPAGHVLVFDDVTTLIQAQRDAAWSEVARRLAHEIKNPLTPIRLSAERLRHKYLATFPEKEAETLDRMTHTIIQQVESLRTLVNAFSDYARTPQILLRPLDLNALVREVLDLYQNSAVPIKLELADDLPLLNADQNRLRQVLHNLLKNALEACTAEDAQIMIGTRYQHTPELQCAELLVHDNGSGIPEKILGQIFEPYVTSKIKGSGLGLAIVKKIVEEHGGMVSIENTEPGVRVAIRLPLVENASKEKDAAETTADPQADAAQTLLTTI